MSTRLSYLFKNYRKNNNLSQQDLAEILFVSRKTISKWETEKGYPEIFMLLNISDLLKITVDELLRNDFKDDFYKKNKKFKKRYILNEMILLFITTIFFILCDIPILINLNHNIISILMFITIISFLILFLIFNYYSNIKKVKKDNKFKTYLLFNNIEKSSITIYVILSIYSLFKLILYIFRLLNIIKYYSLVSTVIFIFLSVNLLIQYLKEEI